MHCKHCGKQYVTDAGYRHEANRECSAADLKRHRAKPAEQKKSVGRGVPQNWGDRSTEQLMPQPPGVVGISWAPIGVPWVPVGVPQAAETPQPQPSWGYRSSEQINPQSEPILRNTQLTIGKIRRAGELFPAEAQISI